MIYSRLRPSYGHRNVGPGLANSELLEFMQQHAHLLCTFFQLEIEEDYWNFVKI
jgi:hypothetical protein